MIIALENAKHELQNFRANIEELGNALRIEELKTEVAELEKVTFDPDFWSNQENSTKILQKIKQMKDKIEKYEALATKLEDTIMMAEMAIEENDESCVEEVENELAETKTIEIVTKKPHALGVYEDNAWYNQWYVWVLSFLLGIVPALILFLIMLIETMVKVAKEFEIGGQNIYGYPYVWIGCLIVPVIGWTVFIIMILYLYIWYIVGLFQGKGEKYLK